MDDQKMMDIFGRLHDVMLGQGHLQRIMLMQLIDAGLLDRTKLLSVLDALIAERSRDLGHLFQLNPLRDAAKLLRMRARKRPDGLPAWLRGVTIDGKWIPRNPPTTTA